MANSIGYVDIDMFVYQRVYSGTSHWTLVLSYYLMCIIVKKNGIIIDKQTF